MSSSNKWSEDINILCVRETTYENSKAYFKNSGNFSSGQGKKSCRILVGAIRFSKPFSFDLFRIFEIQVTKLSF